MLVFFSISCLLFYSLSVIFPMTLYDVTVYFTALSLKQTYESLGMCTLDITQGKAAVVSTLLAFFLSCVVLWQSISLNAWANAKQNVQSAVVTGLAPTQRGQNPTINFNRIPPSTEN